MVVSMRQFSFITVCVLVSTVTSSATAQVPGTDQRRPAFSPYLNLLRGGNPVLNYYGIVRPEQEFRATNQEFLGTFNRVDQRFEDAQAESLRSRLQTSGHRVRFMSDLTGGSEGFGRAATGRLARPTIGQSSRLSTTGHSAYFGNRGTYFPMQNGNRNGHGR